MRCAINQGCTSPQQVYKEGAQAHQKASRSLLSDTLTKSNRRGAPAQNTAQHARRSAAHSTAQPKPMRSQLFISATQALPSAHTSMHNLQR